MFVHSGPEVTQGWPLLFGPCGLDSAEWTRVDEKNNTHSSKFLCLLGSSGRRLSAASHSEVEAPMP